MIKAAQGEELIYQRHSSKNLSKIIGYTAKVISSTDTHVVVKTYSKLTRDWSQIEVSLENLRQPTELERESLKWPSI